MWPFSDVPDLKAMSGLSLQPERQPTHRRSLSASEEGVQARPLNRAVRSIAARSVGRTAVTAPGVVGGVPA